MALKLIYLVMTRIFAWARLAVQDSTAKNIEMLILRHELAVAQRRDPLLARKLTWADRAWLALLARLLPSGQLPKIRLIVTPSTLLHWHRNLLRRRWAHRSRRQPKPWAGPGAA
ncbi:integrase [Saccharopolyspora shandongensis]